MTREQQQATRNLERAQEDWLRAYGWRRELGGRWLHKRQPAPVPRFDALALTRAQPLLYGADVYSQQRG